MAFLKRQPSGMESRGVVAGGMGQRSHGEGGVPVLLKLLWILAGVGALTCSDAQNRTHVCVCVCVCVTTGEVCTGQGRVCVCVCVRENWGGLHGAGSYVRVCVCECE